MKVTVEGTRPPGTMAPLDDIVDCMADYKLGGATLGVALKKRLASVGGENVLGVVDYLWPSDALLAELAGTGFGAVVEDSDGTRLAWASKGGDGPGEGAAKIPLDADSMLIRYPWDLLTVNEIVVLDVAGRGVSGEVAPGVVVDGRLVLGKGSKLLPGVYIEGDVIIGENCKIGPNCYIRGNTFIGDDCHVGQAVEIKNSILMDGVSGGHLSYIGDSIVGPEVNLGAGTITANLRHDNKTQKMKVGDEFVDTGRRKLGAVFGRGVHTGIHTSVYPGRKLWSGVETAPGEIVKKDIRPGNWNLGGLDRRGVEEPFPGSR